MKLLVFGDGVLTRTKSGHIEPQTSDDQVLVDGVAKAIAAYAADGWTMAIASNKHGVVDGFKTEAIAEIRYTLSLLPVKIKEALICTDRGETCYSISPPIRFEYVPNRPHDSISGVMPVHHSADSHIRKLNGTYRKPNSGMLKSIEGDFVVCKKKLMIGGDDIDFRTAVRAEFEYMHVSAWLQSIAIAT